MPRCEVCHHLLTPWIRDTNFLEGKYWKTQLDHYQGFLRDHLLRDEHVLFIESCTVCLLWISILLTVFIRIFSKNILLMFGASDNSLVYALDYLNYYILGTVFVEFATGLVYFITAQGFTKISMLSVSDPVRGVFLAEPTNFGW